MMELVDGLFPMQNHMEQAFVELAGTRYIE
jgi:hypothetical protein